MQLSPEETMVTAVFRKWQGKFQPLKFAVNHTQHHIQIRVSWAG
jgi:hypothetical protein